MRILIVEDEKILSNTIKQTLGDEYEIDQAFDGSEAELYAMQDIYDVIILDIMLPIKNGYEVLETIRKEKILTPVLILTAKDGLNDKLNGFQKGADDYLTKPFAKEELKARIEAMIRRNNPNYYKNEVSFKDLKIDITNRKAYVKDKQLKFQFDSETTANVVEVYASGIRKELKKYNYDKYFKTIRGVGYMIS